MTGGSGFVGSWLNYELAVRGANVVSLDIKPARFLGEPYNALLKKVQYVEGDVRDVKLLRSLFADHKIDTVFHLAASALVGEVLADPAEALDTNIIGTVRVLEEARQHRGVHVVVASSDKAYGPQETLPYTEDFSLRGEFHPYDCSKSCADQIARMYARVYGLSTAVARCGNIYGGGDLHFSRLIPGTIQTMLQGKSIELRSDGLYMRDYIYVKDAVSAYLCLAENLANGKIKGEAFNFGNNNPLRVLEIVDVLARLMEKPSLKPIILNNAKNEILNQYLDSSKSKSVLGWGPAHKIEDGLKETIGWYKRHFQIT